MSCTCLTSSGVLISGTVCSIYFSRALISIGCLIGPAIFTMAHSLRSHIALPMLVVGFGKHREWSNQAEVLQTSAWKPKRGLIPAAKGYLPEARFVLTGRFGRFEAMC